MVWGSSEQSEGLTPFAGYDVQPSSAWDSFEFSNTTEKDRKISITFSSERHCRSLPHLTVLIQAEELRNQTIHLRSLYVTRRHWNPESGQMVVCWVSEKKKKSVCVSAEKGAESERWRSAEWRVRVFMRACLKQAGANLTFSSFRRRWRRGAAHNCSHRKHRQGGSPSAAVIQDKSFF